VWDGYANPPWKSMNESNLRDFLIDRVRDGYSFPINPVWPIRDVGWIKVYEALKGAPSASEAMKAWYPPDSGILPKIEQLHAAHPKGFQKGTAPTAPAKPDDGAGDNGGEKPPATDASAKDGGSPLDMLNKLNPFNKSSEGANEA